MEVSSYLPSKRALTLLTALALAWAILVPTAGAAEPSSLLQPVNGFNPLVALDRGDTGPPVIRLQYALRNAGFYRGLIDGEYGRPTETAVITLHKYLGLDRTGAFSALDWIRLALLPGPDIPYRREEPDRVEIDTTRQLIYVVRDHDVVGVLPTSTGSGAMYYSVRNRRNVRSGTPHGDFTLNWRQYGWNCDRVTGWCVYNYWGFTTYYGIHGYGNVPAYPASHGCVRVHTWDSDWLDDYLFIGMPVHIWRERPRVPPPPPPPPIRFV
ncbi:MAG: L,D-transpeptidase family protein [Acidimicrobiia bacterium]